MVEVEGLLMAAESMWLAEQVLACLLLLSSKIQWYLVK
jgi:hypothetical protein